jgi:radical SAM protein with 4Fe4S-binding SPASM domain
MPKDRAFFLLLDAYFLGASSVKFNFRGESFLYPDLEAVLKLANSLKFVDIMVNTNGVIAPSKLKRLVNYYTTMIISVDSFNPDHYIKIHGCSEKDFRKLIMNLHLLRRMVFGIPYLYGPRSGWHAEFLRPRVKINYHINEINKNDSLEYYYRYFQMFPLVMRHTEARAGKDISVHRGRRERKPVCPHMVRRLTVLANGKTYPCCMAYDEPDDLLLGSAFDTPLVDLWGSSKRKSLIGNYRAGEYTPTCKKCSSSDIWR